MITRIHMTRYGVTQPFGSGCGWNVRARYPIFARNGVSWSTRGRRRPSRSPEGNPHAMRDQQLLLLKLGTLPANNHFESFENSGVLRCVVPAVRSLTMYRVQNNLSVYMKCTRLRLYGKQSDAV